MKKRILAAMCLASAVAPASILTSRAETTSGLSQQPSTLALNWNSVSGVVWGQRNITNYVLQGFYATSNVSAYAMAMDPSLEAAASLATGGYNLFTTAGVSQSSQSILSPNADVFNAVGGVDISSIYSPGSLLAEWNPVPEVKVWTSGNPAVDNYSPNFAPGSLLATADEFQFTTPDLILAGAYRSTQPALSPNALATAGVNPQTFAGVAPYAAGVSPAATAATTTTPAADLAAAPSQISSPAAAPATPTAKAPEASPASAPVSRVSTPVSTETVAVAAAPVLTPSVQSIADVAASFMTTSQDTSPATRNIVLSFANPPSTQSRTVTGQALDTAPEPGTAGVMALGAGFLALLARRRKK